MDVRRLSIHPNRRAGLLLVAATVACPGDAVFIEHQLSESRRLYNPRSCGGMTAKHGTEFNVTRFRLRHMVIAESLRFCIVRSLTANISTNTGTTQTGSHIEIDGRVIAVLPGTMFKVQLSNGHVVLAHISGKLRKHFIKIAAGDTVKMEMSPYDTDKARITYRAKDTGYRPPPRRRY
jgi:translation initiation factor IF-1